MSRTINRAYRQTLWAGLLLAILVTALLVEGIPVVHAHVDGEAGLYNAACSLSLLAAPTGGVPLPTLDLSSSHLPERPAPIEIAESSPQSPFVLGSASRAPPVV